MHGAGNAWIGGYIDVYRGHFGGILAFMGVSVIVSAFIALMAGATNLSRTNPRNVLEHQGETHPNSQPLHSKTGLGN